MGVALKHPVISVPRYESHLRNAQSLFNEPANRFVAQVMEPEIENPTTFEQGLPAMPKLRLSHSEGITVADNFVSGRTKWNATRGSSSAIVIALEKMLFRS